ncbi:hypothetical protein [Clostridium sp. OS1-26]|uniref:hypothetical protein n=1 Tax=Clostridium sp. OS1-26 TaxID=3070681 RepID=UPI0027E1DC87|nr:hypothetical protein [Clostridium sp. OS1-26]WML36640.1 hypothetical protein RCG18_08440 [Clostridium sp. OS1-26]
MAFYIAVIILSLFIPCNLIGLYYFSKQEYNNYFVSLLLNKDKLELLKSGEINQKNYRKIKFILNVQTILLILLSMIFIYIFKSYNITIRYIIIILAFMDRFISNKLIEKIL